MTTLEIGIFLLVLWLANWIFMLTEFLRHTPNWRDEDVDPDELVKNFLMNTPLEKIQMIQATAQTNPLLGISGCILILFALI